MKNRLQIRRLGVMLLFLYKTGFANTIKDRAIPVEHSCDRLPYILKEKELQFSYSAEHLKYSRCAVTITGTAYTRICVNFSQYYLDCNTNIILVDGAVSSFPRKTYKCDSEHSSDFCSSETTLEVIFDRKNSKQPGDFGHVELNIYGKGETDSTKVSLVTAFVIFGGILGLVLLLIVSAIVLSRVMYHYHYKPTSKQRQFPDERRCSHEEIPLGPPPPYQEHDTEETGLTIQ